MYNYIIMIITKIQSNLSKMVPVYRVLKMCQWPTISPFTFTFSPVKKKCIEHGFSNNFYVYVNCRYRVLLIYIFLSITFTIAINRRNKRLCDPRFTFSSISESGKFRIITLPSPHVWLHAIHKQRKISAFFR